MIRTDPAEGTDLTDVEMVTLVVSDGPATTPVAVISFLDMSETEARDIAAEMGLNPVFEDAVYSDEHDADTVCWQSIQPNTSVAEGTTIRFRLSLGPDPEASPSPSVEPTATPEPSPTPDSGVELKDYTFNVNLPRDGRETVHVRVSVGGVDWVNDYYDTIMQVIPVTVRGTGVQEIVVYIDGVASYTESHNFG